MRYARKLAISLARRRKDYDNGPLNGKLGYKRPGSVKKG